MTIIEIIPSDNGSHRNQTTTASIPVPEGWAVVPEGLETPNFPFGTVETAEIDGIMTVTRWTAGEIPEPEPEPPVIPAPSNAQLQSVVRLATMQAQALPDAQALTVPELYPTWAAGTAYAAQYIVSRPNGHLYRCQQGHTSQDGWEPEATPALWVVIAGSEAGTAEDPIPAARGMEYTYGKYYRDPEDGRVYLCQRTGEAEGGTVVLQYLPHELVGQYFAEA